MPQAVPKPDPGTPKPPIHTGEDDLVAKPWVKATTGLSSPTIDRWVRENRFPKPIKFGDSRSSPIRWRKSAIREWIALMEDKSNA